MPPINTSEDLIPAIASVWEGLRDGHLTPEEAAVLSIVVDRSVQAVELHSIIKRLAVLEEEAVAKRDERRRTPSYPR
jgi:hypothetical protein